MNNLQDLWFRLKFIDIRTHPKLFSPKIIVPVDRDTGQMHVDTDFSEEEEEEEPINFESGNYKLDLSY